MYSITRITVGVNNNIYVASNEDDKNRIYAKKINLVWQILVLLKIVLLSLWQVPVLTFSASAF